MQSVVISFSFEPACRLLPLLTVVEVALQAEFDLKLLRNCDFFFGNFCNFLTSKFPKMKLIFKQDIYTLKSVFEVIMKKFNFFFEIFDQKPLHLPLLLPNRNPLTGSNFRSFVRCSFPNHETTTNFGGKRNRVWQPDLLLNCCQRGCGKMAAI